MQKDHILIICSQNSARSQMAEAFFRKYGEDFVEVDSADSNRPVLIPSL